MIRLSGQGKGFQQLYRRNGSGTAKMAFGAYFMSVQATRAAVEGFGGLYSATKRRGGHRAKTKGGYSATEDSPNGCSHRPSYVERSAIAGVVHVGFCH